MSETTQRETREVTTQRRLEIGVNLLDRSIPSLFVLVLIGIIALLASAAFFYAVVWTWRHA